MINPYLAGKPLMNPPAYATLTDPGGYSQVFLCPSDKETVAYYNTSHCLGWNGISYGIHGWLYYVAPQKGAGLDLSKIPNPAQDLYLSEHRKFTPPEVNDGYPVAGSWDGPGFGTLGSYHQGYVNTLYLDGHVQFDNTARLAVGNGAAINDPPWDQANLINGAVVKP